MSRRLPNLDQLRAFEVAARHLSFTRAAEELNITQTAVSHRIRALEEDLGEPQFRRHVRAVSLTDSADILARRLGPTFEAIGSAVDDFTRAELSGELRISVVPYFGNRVFLPLLPEFHIAFPGLRILPTMSTELVDLTTAAFDGAVRYGDGDWPGLEAVKVLTDELSPVAAPHLVAGRELPLPPAKIAQMELVARFDGDDDWKRWFAAVGSRSEAPTNVESYSTLAGGTDMALAGLGVALCEARLVQDDIALGRLVELNPERITSQKSIYVVYPVTKRPNPRLLRFAEWMRERLSGSS